MIVFFLFGLSIAAFLFLLILLKRNKNNADRILGTWMAYMTIHVGLFVVHDTGLSYRYPHLLGILLPVPILHGAFLYFYTLQSIQSRFPALKTVALHSLPFLLLTGLAVPFYSLSADEKVTVFLNQGRGYEWYGLIQMTFFILCGFGYSIASILEIRKHRKRMMNVFSNHEKKTLTWLEWMAIGLGCIWLLAAFFDDYVIFSGVVFFILFIGIFGINQTPVFFPASYDQTLSGHLAVTPANEPSTEKYQKSGLTSEDTRRLLDSLEMVMIQQKPHKNPDLTLDQLASLMKVNPNQLSQVINAGLGKTFYHYINGYRIREFLRVSALPDSRKLTFVGLASDCGFQSKSTFNKYFKLETGKSPSEYFQA